MTQTASDLRFIAIWASAIGGSLFLLGGFEVFFPFLVPLYIAAVAAAAFPDPNEAWIPGRERPSRQRLYGGIVAVCATAVLCVMAFDRARPLSDGWGPSWTLFAGLASFGALFAVSAAAVYAKRPGVRGPPPNV